jgi:hypothetical protein
MTDHRKIESKKVNYRCATMGNKGKKRGKIKTTKGLGIIIDLPGGGGGI